MNAFDELLPHLIERLAYQLNADLTRNCGARQSTSPDGRILACSHGDGITIN